MSDVYLSMDVGGSKYMVGLITRDGKLLRSRKDTWQQLNQETVLAQLLSESKALLAEGTEQPVACGITIPGLADAEKGIWKEASFSGICDFPICAEVSAALHLPCYGENDGQAYALGEAIFGCCQDVQDFLFMNISNGIGGAIVSGGRLLQGSLGFAGEFGHCHVVDGGRPCKCGQVGCL